MRSASPTPDSLPPTGNTHRLVAQWQNKIANETVAAEDAKVRRPETKVMRSPSVLSDSRPCLCSCHERQVFTFAASAPTTAPTPVSPAPGIVTRKTPGAAYALLSRIPRPKRLRRPPTPLFEMVNAPARISPECAVPLR